MGWFRLHDGTLDNPKVQRLKPELFKAWVNLLCVANRHGGVLPGPADLAFELRVPEAKARAFVTALVEARLIDDTGDGHRPHDWDEHQYVTGGGSAERMRRHRARHRDGDVTQKPVTSDAVTQDAPLSEQTTEQNRTEREGVTASQASPSASPAAPPPPAKRGTRLTIEALPVDWRDFCERERPDLDALRTFANFRDHFTSSSGRNAAKLDWLAAWRLWVRRERRLQQLDFGHGQRKPSDLDNRRAAADAVDEVVAEAKARRAGMGY